MAWAWILQSLLTEWMEPTFPDKGVFRATNLSWETDEIVIQRYSILKWRNLINYIIEVIQLMEIISNNGLC